MAPNVFHLNDKVTPNGTVLLFDISYPGGSVTYTYVIMKSGGRWYVSGTNGRNPQAAGWGAVERWVAQDNRVVERVRFVSETVQLWRRERPDEKPADEPAGDDEHTENGYPDECPEHGRECPFTTH